MDQFFANGLVACSTYWLLGLGCFFIFSVCKRIDLSLSGVAALGPYLVLGLRVYCGSVASVIISLGLMFIFGYYLQSVVYSRLSGRTGQSSLLLSLGLYLVVENVIALVFGSDRRTLRYWEVREGILFAEARLTKIQVVSIFISLALVLLIWLLVSASSYGRAMRAIASNYELAQALALDVEMGRATASGLGFFFAATGGILLSFDFGLVPGMGLQPLLRGLAAAIFAGGTVPGLLLGGLFIGLSENLSVAFIPSQWQDSVVFAAIVVFLIVNSVEKK